MKKILIILIIIFLTSCISRRSNKVFYISNKIDSHNFQELISSNNIMNGDKIILEDDLYYFGEIII